MNAQIQYGSTSHLTPTRSQPDSEVVYFSGPVRSGRRRHDQIGHLEMTNLRFRFHAAIDINVGWDEVAGIERVDRDLIVAVGDRPRQFRFCFHTAEEANQGALVARSIWSAPAPAPSL